MRLTIACTRERVSHGGRGSRPAKNILYSASRRFSSASSSERSCETPLSTSVRPDQERHSTGGVAWRDVERHADVREAILGKERCGILSSKIVAAVEPG